MSILLLATISDAGGAAAQVDQHELAMRLLSGHSDERIDAAETARRMGAAQITPELRTALLVALEQEGRLAAQRRSGEIGYLKHPEVIARLAMVVAELGDPRAIPGLAGALGTSPPAMYALAAFGDPAARSVLEVLARENDTSVTNDGLVALRFMAEGAGAMPLSPETLTRIRGVVEEHLTGSKSVTTLWRAMDLAVALGDPEFKEVIRSLATSREEVVARGVSDPDLVEKTQQLASDLLAGVPPIPRWRKLPSS